MAFGRRSDFFSVLFEGRIHVGKVLILVCFFELFFEDVFEGLGVVDPLEDTEHFFDGDDFEAFDLKFFFGAFSVIFEYFVHDVEHFFDSLIETDILTALDEEHVPFLVGAIQCDSFGLSLRLKSQYGEVKGLNKDAIP